MPAEIASNRRAYHHYRIIDKIEAGIELKGTEVKSIRAGLANLPLILTMIAATPITESLARRFGHRVACLIGAVLLAGSLAGLAVKVTDGFFLVGLSNVDADRARNIQLLKERSWFDVPLVYSNQRRAIIAIEKGAPGERAFNDAFAQWGE